MLKTRSYTDFKDPMLLQDRVGSPQKRALFKANPGAFPKAMGNLVTPIDRTETITHDSVYAKVAYFDSDLKD